MAHAECETSSRLLLANALSLLQSMQVKLGFSKLQNSGTSPSVHWFSYLVLTAKNEDDEEERRAKLYSGL